MVTTADFLNFWAKAIPSLQVHPDDRAALTANGHSLALDTLVGPWMGPIRTAPVILLTLNGGLAGTGEEARSALMPEVRASVARNLGGEKSLPDWTGNPAGRTWTEARLSQFGLSYAAAESKVAFVNLIPYRSKNGAQDMQMADRLTSSRMTRAWMRDTVFKEAEAGERVVVCLRSHRQWGLERGRTYGLSLFAPNVNRAGYILLDEREPIGKAVRRAVFTDPAPMTRASEELRP